MRRAIAPERDPADKLTAAIRALVRSARDEILLYELLVLPPSRDTQDFLADTSSPVDVLADIVAEGQRRRTFASFDARLIAECILGAVHRVAIARRLGTLPRRLTEYEDDLAAAAVRATAAVRSRRRSSG